MRDKRIKSCPNAACEHNINRKTHKYTAEDHYCSICSSELVFACARCLGPLTDEGPKHKICRKCEGEIADRKAKAKKIVYKVGAGAGTLGTGIIAIAKSGKLKKVLEIRKFIK